jgi:hypothetical protein
MVGRELLFVEILAVLAVGGKRGFESFPTKEP